jgi:large subunit ribosomal protein L10
VSRQDRTQEIERLKGDLAHIRNAVLIHYRGVTVPQITDLRAQVRKVGGHYAVVKNTLLTRAVEGAPLGKFKDHLKGPTALLWSDKEPVALAKTLHAFAKTVPVIQVRALLLDGELIPAAGLEQVANLPSREALRGKLVGLLASPLARLATVLNGPARNVVAVLAQRAEKIK